ncbi:acyl-phosphate glycerol-3-phosphate acyltransferase [Alkalispirillum mobile]|uniref:Glycerol-3-phosphate acyltransferase n=1 Tax=Alkalispirillum mobile TaxID=85925 RepID=A0A498C5F0_9GAMM|nr:glycerol-3-phosphate 1-O-acyltransferase PlsY [Alkalispirillum mobile]RLK48220.1 acyl-phosphate glycerol-3-phosphate acyltransferase [Alkalispirillum mobile]
MIMTILLIIAAYLFGSISSAVLVCKAFRLPDPRQEGSGNPGATNVLRLGGKLPAALTLGFDWLKGMLPVLVALALLDGLWGIGLVGLAAFLGHLYPVFFGFQGGKGVATGLGVLLGWSPVALLLTGATWLLVAAASRYSSLAALIAFVLAPVWIAVVTGSAALTTCMFVITAFSWWRHRSNLKRLAAGEEPKIGRRKG